MIAARPELGLPVIGTDPVPGGWATKIVVPALLGLRNAAVGLFLHPERVHSALSGPYLSIFKGRGVEFTESRPYQAGDEVRYIDWRVTARTGKPYTKVYHEDREQVILVWVDLRRAMFFASRGTFKAVLAARCAAVLAWGAALRGNRLGGLLFAEDRHWELRPACGNRTVLQLIGQLATFAPPSSPTPATVWADSREMSLSSAPMEEALIRLRRVTRSGSQLFLLSDFVQLRDREKVHLAQLARQNDVVMIFFYDQLERTLPPPGWYPVTEGNRHFLLESHTVRVRRQYQEQFQSRLEDLHNFCRQHGIVLLPCSTTEDVVVVLQKIFGLKPRTHRKALP